MTEPAAELTDRADPDAVDNASSTLDVVLAQTAGSSDTDDATDLGHRGVDADGPDGSDLTADVVLVDDPAAWSGQLGGAVDGNSTVGTISTIAADGGPPAGWQRVAMGFLLGYTGASRAAYAADLRDYLTW